MGEEPNHTTARTNGSLEVIQYSLLHMSRRTVCVNIVHYIVLSITCTCTGTKECIFHGYFRVADISRCGCINTSQECIEWPWFTIGGGGGRGRGKDA
jgi:hypothetical protein